MEKETKSPHDPIYKELLKHCKPTVQDIVEAQIKGASKELLEDMLFAVKRKIVTMQFCFVGDNREIDIGNSKRLHTDIARDDHTIITIIYMTPCGMYVRRVIDLFEPNLDEEINNLEVGMYSELHSEEVEELHGRIII